MSFDYKVKDGYISIALYGVVSPSDLREIVQRFREFESTTGIAPHRITDLSRVEVVGMHFAEMNAYVTDLRSIKWKNDARSAIVAPTPLHFGMARMFQTLAENSQVEVGIFPDCEAALQWIRRTGSPSKIGPPSQSPDPTLASGTPPAGQEPRPR